MFAGLARLGVPVSAAGARAASHGPLFVSGVFFPDLLDDEPYLDQLAVRVMTMRRGIGGQLLAHAAAWACSD